MKGFCTRSSCDKERERVMGKKHAIKREKPFFPSLDFSLQNLKSYNSERFWFSILGLLFNAILIFPLKIEF